MQKKMTSFALHPRTLSVLTSRCYHRQVIVNFYGILNEKLARNVPRASQAFELLREYTQLADEVTTVKQVLRDVLGEEKAELTDDVMGDILQAWREWDWVSEARSRLQIVDTQTSSNTAEEYYSWVDVSNTLPRQATRAWSRFENSVRRTQDLWTHTYRCFAQKPTAQGLKRFGVVIAPTALLREHVKALLLTRDYNIFVDGVTDFQSSELNGREEMFYVVAAGLGVWRDGAHERAMLSVELLCCELLASMLPEPIIAEVVRPQPTVKYEVAVA